MCCDTCNVEHEAKERCTAWVHLTSPVKQVPHILHNPVRITSPFYYPFIIRINQPTSLNLAVGWVVRTTRAQSIWFDTLVSQLTFSLLYCFYSNGLLSAREEEHSLCNLSYSQISLWVYWDVFTVHHVCVSCIGLYDVYDDMSTGEQVTLDMNHLMRWVHHV